MRVGFFLVVLFCLGVVSSALSQANDSKTPVGPNVKYNWDLSNVSFAPFVGCPPSGPVTGAFTGTNTQLGRFFRDGIASVCPGKAYPGIHSAGTTFNYSTYTYSNTSAAAACVTINFDPNFGGTPCALNAQMSAYANSYDPMNQGTNFLGDVGSSVTQPFSFEVPANSEVVLVVTNTIGQAICDFAFEVVGLPCVEAVPTLGEWGLIIIGIILLIVGVVAIGLRKTAFA